MVPRDAVLVVDDDAVSRQLLVQTLTDEDLAVADAGSGAEALAWVAQNMPAVVLLDLMMPPPDGFAVLRALRADTRTHDVPVLVLTAHDSDEDVSRAFELGADDFVRKPFRTTELIARIRSQLRIRDYLDAINQKERDAKVVLELTQTLASTLDFRNILFTVVQRIAEVVQVDRCSIVLVRDKGDIGYVVAASDDQQIRDLPINLGKYPEIRQVMATGRPLVIPDAQAHPIFEVVRADLPRNTFRSLAILPILFEQRSLGVLFLRARRPVTLHTHELSLAHTIATATGIALRNARIFQSLRDQTQQVTFARFEAERRLKALQRYADFFYSTADGIIVIDSEGQILFSNPRAHEITGHGETDLASNTFADLLTPRDEPRFREVLAGFAKDVYPQMVDLTIRRGVEPPGIERILSVSFGSVPREESDPREESETILVSFRDVTAERATESELTKTKEFLERVIESSADAIISADMKGLVRLFNRAAERVYGYEAKDVVGTMSVRKLYPEGSATRIMRLIHSKDYGGPGRLEGYRTEVVAKDGTRIPVMLSAALILESGTPVGSVGIFTDLRERLRMEARLNEAQEELRAREKQALIAELAGAAAHELNQPLTSVLGYAELIRRRLPGVLQGGPDPSADAASVTNAVEVMVTEAERMAEIVRKIGKITRYETKTYVGAAKIIDLDRSSDDEDPNRAVG